MEVRDRFYDIDDLWRIVSDPANSDRRFELVEGELFEMAPPGEEHGQLSIMLGKYLFDFVQENQLGRVTADTGYYPTEDRTTLLAPDIAFRRLEHTAAAPSQKWVPLMPDVAVEIKSPNDTMAELRRKAAIYLRNGTQRVWIVVPNSKSIEVCQLGEDDEIQRDVIAKDGMLSGENVLPGFELPLAKLFAW